MTTTPDIRTGTRMTLAEFLDLPEQEKRCELIDGVVYMAAFPIPDHQFLAMALSGYMFQQIMETGLGIVYQVAGVVVSDDSALGPDIVVVRAERVGIIGPTVIDGGPPDIVVEVLSSNRHADLVRKRQLYAAAGVAEYWILDGEADTLTALELADDGWYQERAVLTTADTLTTPLFSVFSLPLAQVFDHPARIRQQQ